MIIDVHTHVAPEKIAETVVTNLERDTGHTRKGVNTIPGIKAHMKAAGTDVSVVLVLALEARQVKRANDWMVENQDESIIGFGSIHPDDHDRVAEVRRLKEKGIKGLKIHSSVHRCYPDDERMLPVYEEAGEDMIVLFHAGKFTNDDDVVWAGPASIARVADMFPRMKIIAGHLGGLYMLEEAKNDLYGKNVFIETSWPPGIHVHPQETVLKIIELHGSDRLLLGSDYPMGSQIEDIKYIMDLPISSEDKDKILGENARQLLGL
jgi:hypothetical protein